MFLNQNFEYSSQNRWLYPCIHAKYGKVHKCVVLYNSCQSDLGIPHSNIQYMGRANWSHRHLTYEMILTKREWFGMSAVEGYMLMICKYIHCKRKKGSHVLYCFTSYRPWRWKICICSWSGGKVWMMMHSEQITQQIADAGLLKFTPYTNHHYRSNHPFPSIFPSQDIWLLWLIKWSLRIDCRS